MSQDKIHDAMNYLDDDLIESVDMLRQSYKYKSNRKIFTIKTFLASAASILIVLVGVSAVFRVMDISIFDLDKFTGTDKFKSESFTHEDSAPIINENATEINDAVSNEGSASGELDEEGINTETVIFYGKVISWEKGGFRCRVTSGMDDTIAENNKELLIAYSPQTIVCDEKTGEAYGYTDRNKEKYSDIIKIGEILRIEVMYVVDDCTVKAMEIRAE